MFKVVEADKPVMGRAFIIKNLKTGHHVVGSVEAVIHPKRFRSFEQPAHYHRRNADILCAYLNENYDEIMKGAKL